VRERERLIGERKIDGGRERERGVSGGEREGGG
jgi:hypothetical protein